MNKQEPDFFSTQVAKASRFYIEPANSHKSKINVVCGGCEHTDPNFKIERDDFPYYSIEFVAQGKGSLILAGKTFELRPTAVFTYGPGVSQIITTDPKDTLIKYFIDFSGAASKKMLAKYNLAPGAFKVTGQPVDITRVFDEIIKDGLSESPYRTLRCSTLLEYLILRIAETATIENTQTTQACLTYQNCRDYIRSNFIKLNSLDEIARNCNIDKAYLCRLFKQFDTQSPYQYLLSTKLTYAAKRLQRPQIMVKEIAYELGFNDPFHFSKVFKRVFGVSPKYFQKLRQSELSR